MPAALSKIGITMNSLIKASSSFQKKIFNRNKNVKKKTIKQSKKKWNTAFNLNRTKNKTRKDLRPE